MESSFEQVIQEHLELRKRSADREAAPLPEQHESAPDGGAEAEEPPPDNGEADVWVEDPEFDWGVHRHEPRTG